MGVGEIGKKWVGRTIKAYEVLMKEKVTVDQGTPRWKGKQCKATRACNKKKREELDIAAKSSPKKKGR